MEKCDRNEWECEGKCLREDKVCNGKCSEKYTLCENDMTSDNETTCKRSDLYFGACNGQCLDPELPVYLPFSDRCVQDCLGMFQQFDDVND